MDAYPGTLESYSSVNNLHRALEGPSGALLAHPGASEVPAGALEAHPKKVKLDSYCTEDSVNLYKIKVRCLQPQLWTKKSGIPAL